MDTNHTNWHSISASKAIEVLKSRESGLDNRDVQNRLRIYGQNRIEEGNRTNLLMRFISQFNNLLIYILLISSLITLTLANYIDTIVILVVVLINAVIGFFQEGKAEQALTAIQKYLILEVNVLRDGRWQSVDAQEIVPGDIVRLKSGDKVPADIRLINSTNLQAQEAILTGESFPVDKAPKPVKKETPLGDRSSMVFAGTLITSGQGYGVVVQTGMNSEIGQITETIKEIQTLETPLVRQIHVFNRWVTFAILLAALIIFCYGLFIVEMSIPHLFIAIVSFTVAAIPEGLPVIMTITMASGVVRMARKNAIIRQLPAVETLGAVTVICTDKTGTLTKNEQTAQAIITDKYHYVVTGVGYLPLGEILINGSKVQVENNHDLYLLMLAASLCNDAELDVHSKTPALSGAPMDGALLTLVHKAGLDPKVIRQNYTRLDVIPFSSEEKLMATLNKTYEGKANIFVKGAPEVLLSHCRFASKEEEKRWQDVCSQYASKGMRLLGFSMKKISQEVRSLTLNKIKSEMSFLGIIAFIDPPREATQSAIETCKLAGIEVKMITGDHSQTAKAIAEQIHLDDNLSIITGEEIDKIDEEGFSNLAVSTHIFARANPIHKLRLIQALQNQNQLVAMTGDGVNDAPALKRADISISMGLKGTEAAKEASKIVLVDDRFSTIVDAIKEGRIVFENLRKSILFVLPTGAGEAAIIFIALLLGVTLPITPLQILWINTITAVTLGIPLAFESADQDLMRRPPRRRDDPILSKYLTWRLFFVAFLVISVSFGSFYFSLQQGYSIEAARTITVQTLVGCEIVYLINCRRLNASVLNYEGVFGNKAAAYAIAAVVVIQLGFTYLPVFQTIFETTNLQIKQWLISIIGALILFFSVEAEKYLVNKYVAKE